MALLLGYFITFHTYGSWLHGRDKGSVDDEHNVPGSPLLPPDAKRERAEHSALKRPPVELDAERRYVVDATLREVCQYRRWTLHALHPRVTHVHVIVTASPAPERVMNDFKAYGTRRMREAGVLAREVEPWSYHGSTRYLDSERSFELAMNYVLNEQGPPLEMRCPEGWLRKA